MVVEVTEGPLETADLVWLEMTAGPAGRLVCPVACRDQRCRWAVKAIGFAGIIEYAVDAIYHDSVVGDLVAESEHGVVAATVDSQRRTDPNPLLTLVQGRSERSDAVGEGLDRGLGWYPGC